jgi:hypothetical protein
MMMRFSSWRESWITTQDREQLPDRIETPLTRTRHQIGSNLSTTQKTDWIFADRLFGTQSNKKIPWSKGKCRALEWRWNEASQGGVETFPFQQERNQRLKDDVNQNWNPECEGNPKVSEISKIGEKFVPEKFILWIAGTGLFWANNSGENHHQAKRSERKAPKKRDSIDQQHHFSLTIETASPGPNALAIQCVVCNSVILSCKDLPMGSARSANKWSIESAVEMSQP